MHLSNPGEIIPGGISIEVLKASLSNPWELIPGGNFYRGFRGQFVEYGGAHLVSLHWRPRASVYAFRLFSFFPTRPSHWAAFLPLIVP